MYRQGFTLIELLVVIAIIGILASVVMASLNSARVKSRDARRMADMGQIRNALEMYSLDNGHYPIMATGWTSFDSPAYSNNAITNPSAANLATALAPYLPAGMKDPIGGTSDAGYLYRSESTSSGASYCILIYRTPENMKDFPSHMIPMGRCVAISNGQCSGINAIYYGNGPFATGC
ncbi:hypothetical protein A2392_01395 [Candidatus Kaiserbacteria bacterium RIFOXYB1_FULL_46_14]|uniref:Uncharacterized protein n=1 Tax=Candidatus Kaiserbacteria bacterium RIFOXYB1_FULL_46_14 TaxID=1798531 RepID=A0A1F6FJR0_9BACT|nr:MAG: hypothetical protein A2392_01395 [Candidatus Kaiserbacteria bacterium RIFOXYB1_FULL_46_14]